ncbi:MAG: hypothetical protein EOP01_06575, partial [Propionibacteriaceae bacterium]
MAASTLIATVLPSPARPGESSEEAGPGQTYAAAARARPTTSARTAETRSRSAGVTAPSHVLTALGVGEAEARSVVRFSLGHT